MTIQLNVKELVYTPDVLLQNSKNNNKFQNMIVLQGEQD